MNNNNTIPAEISAQLAAGATATAPYYEVNITQKLCMAACADERPVFSPSFSVVSFDLVGTAQYVVTLHVEGVVNYTPCGCGSCCTKSQMISQDFTVPVQATGITDVTVTPGVTVNSIAKIACRNCSKTFVSETPIVLTITTA